MDVDNAVNVDDIDGTTLGYDSTHPEKKHCNSGSYIHNV
jgi:hypothetical protein